MFICESFTKVDYGRKTQDKIPSHQKFCNSLVEDQQ